MAKPQQGKRPVNQKIGSGKFHTASSKAGSFRKNTSVAKTSVAKTSVAKKEPQEGVWLFGLHAVQNALLNPSRKKKRLLVTPNAAQRLKEAIDTAKLEPEIQDPRRFKAPLDSASVHQGAALCVDPLDWGGLEAVCNPQETAAPVVLLDRVTDPHNVGAVLRSAEALGACAVIAPWRYSAPESGALAKAASGALEWQPYLRVSNLARAMAQLQDLGYVLIGLAGEAEQSLGTALEAAGEAPVALVLGAEGPGLRQLTRENCDRLACIPAGKGFASLNVSNAAAIALYAAVVQRH